MVEIRRSRDRECSPLAVAAALALAGGLLSVAPGPVSGQADPAVGPQPGSFGFDARAGVALPAGGLTAAVDPGASLGGDLSHFLGRHFGLWAGADLQFLSGATDDAGNSFPDMRMLHAGIGGELNLFGGYDLRDDPDPTPFVTTLRLGIGLTDFSTEEALDGGAPSPVAFDPTELSLRGGLTAGWQATPRVKVYLGSTAYLALTDRAETQAYASLSPEVDTFDTAWVVPVQAGVRLTTR